MLSRLSLKFKLTMLVVSIVAVVSFVFARLMYNGLTHMLDKIIGLRAVTAAQAIAQFASPEWLESMNPTSLDAGESTQLEARLGTFVQNGYVNRVEVVRYFGEKEAEMMVSLPVDGSLDYVPPGKLERVTPGGLYSNKGPGYSPVGLDLGVYVAGWAPVVLDGNSVGLVIVYVDSNEVNKALETASLAILITMISFTLLSGLTAYKFSATFEKTAVTDGLMGIYNHKYFKQRLEEEVAKARRYGQQTTMVLLDIDFFKRVNDTYGHATGDIVLKNLAKWVTDSARTTDVVARYGGEEIALILPHTTLAGAQEFAERLRQKIASQVVRDPEEKAEFRVTVSIGVAQWEHGVGMIDMIKRADAALYHSKHTGRNRVSIFQEEILESPPQASNTKPSA